MEEIEERTVIEEKEMYIIKECIKSKEIEIRITMYKENENISVISVKEYEREGEIPRKLKEYMTGIMRIYIEKTTEEERKRIKFRIEIRGDRETVIKKFI